MRFPISKIWRAFPELDRYSDEQCSRFVRAASSGVVHQVVYGFTLFATSVMGGILGLAMVALGTRGVRSLGITLRDGTLALVCNAVAVVTPFAAIFLSMLLARDFLLRRRIRKFLADRTRCTCGYMLLGLRPDESLRVTCPECGAVITVDPALVELVRDGTGHMTISKPVSGA